MIRLIIGFAIVAAIGFGAKYAHDTVWQDGYDTRDAKAKVEKADAIAVAVNAERELHTKEKKAYENKLKSLQRREQEFLAGAADAERLLDASGDSLRAAAETHAACIVSARTHANVFAQCQREYREVAKAADGHVADIKALID